MTSKYSTIVDGKVLPWKFTQQHQDFIYNFYLGDMRVGQVFRHTCRSRTTWTALARSSNDIGLVNGFATRHAAADMILKLEGYDGPEIKYGKPVKRERYRGRYTEEQQDFMFLEDLDFLRSAKQKREGKLDVEESGMFKIILEKIKERIEKT